MEYQPRRGRSEGHPLLWLVGVVVLLVSCAFIYHLFTRRSADPKPDVPKPDQQMQAQMGDVKHPKPSIGVEPRRMPAAPIITNKVVRPPVEAIDVKPPVQPSPPRQQPPDANVLRVQKWLETAQDRPANERVLLQRLLAAEREKNSTLAIDTIKKLYTRPSMADIQDALMRRLGDLNLEVLFSGQNNPLVTTVTAKRGDSRDRLARENRTPVAAIVRLNPKIKWEKLKPGDMVRTLYVPSPTLVIYRNRGYADLSLKGGQYFSRYDVTVKTTAQNGTYPITSESGESVFSRFRDLGIKATKRAEIEMFLPKDSRIVVAD